MECQGQLGKYRLPDLLQGLTAMNATGVLRIHDSRGLDAEIGLIQGQPRWARLGHLRGKEALLACTFWYEGSFHFREQEVVEADAGSAEALTPDFQVSQFLFHALYMADELERRRSMVPAPTDRLRWVKSYSGKDPFGCGLHEVQAYLASQGGSATLAELEERLPLAPVKVRLAVAYLVEVGAVTCGSVGPPEVEQLGQMSEGYRKERALRVLIIFDGETVPRNDFYAIEHFLKENLKVTNSWTSYSAMGLSFIRLLLAEGGVLFVSCIQCTSSQSMRDCLAIAMAHDRVIIVAATADMPWAREIGVETVRVVNVQELLENFPGLEVYSGSVAL